jgi:hypothetical protein
MVEALAVALVLLWVVVIVQGLLLVGTLRQLGRLMSRLGGEQPLDRPTTLRVGDALPDVLRQGPDVAWRVVLFVSPTCSVCEQVLSGLSRLVPDTRQLVLVPQASPTAAREYAEGYGLGSYAVVADPDGFVLDSIGIGEVPFAVLADRNWDVRRTAVVNTAYQVETILAAAAHLGAAA